MCCCSERRRRALLARLERVGAALLRRAIAAHAHQQGASGGATDAHAAQPAVRGNYTHSATE